VKISIAPAGTYELEIDELLAGVSRALAVTARDGADLQRRLGGASDDDTIAAQRDAGSW
jgi:hypothetical protein